MSAQDLGGESDTEAGGSGKMPKPHTIQLELVDEPGQLLVALKSISDSGGNLLPIFHEHGNLTPRGRISVEVDLECPPDRFVRIVRALRDADINAIRAGVEHFGEEVTVILVGDIVDSGLSDALHRTEPSVDATLQDLSLSAREGTDEASSARFRLTVCSGRADETLGVVRDIAVEEELYVIRPLMEGPQ